MSTATASRPSVLSAWWTVLRISLEERLVYRGDFALGTLMRFLPIITQIFLWGAVFAAASGDRIAGFNYHEMIAYYLLAMLGRAFSSMPGLASGIARSIRDGSVKKFLIQPIDMVGFLLLTRLAHKLVYYVIAAVPFALVFFLCRTYFPGWPDAVTIMAFLSSLVMAFLLGFFMEAAIGMIGFWFLEVSSLLFIYMLVSFFLSGHMFPLNMLDKIKVFGDYSGLTWWDVVQCTPFQYLAFFPAAVFLEKIQGWDLALGLLNGFGWVMFFVAACGIAYDRGVKQYSAFGG